jgi:hypothetical protein
MIHRVALLVASLAAALVLAVGMAMAGLAPASSPAPRTDGDQVVAATDSAAPPEPAIQVDTVYLVPPGEPADVTLTKVVRAPSGEHEDEHESGGDD